jgi:hypothetical protein
MYENAASDVAVDQSTGLLWIAGFNGNRNLVFTKIPASSQILSNNWVFTTAFSPIKNIVSVAAGGGSVYALVNDYQNANQPSSNLYVCRPYGGTGYVCSGPYGSSQFQAGLTPIWGLAVAVSYESFYTLFEIAS